MRQKGVRFLENVVGDADRADEFVAMSTEDYAELMARALAQRRVRTSVEG